jgi:hypothetical protein
MSPTTNPCARAANDAGRAAGVLRARRVVALPGAGAALARAVVVVVVAAVVGAVFLGACAHPASPPSPDRGPRVLESSFVAFTAVRLDDLEDAERAIARLESIRLEWLLLLGDGAARVSSPKSEHDGQLALLRLAELHLDLAARIRRIPYPAGVDGADRAAFDAALSRLALPLEATGQGVLAQITDRAARTGADGRFVRRARLYQRLHAGHALSDADLRLVGSELVASTYRAPSTLLQAGRIGQRASR